MKKSLALLLSGWLSLTTAFADSSFVAPTPSFTRVNIQQFVATGTYTPTAGILYSQFICIGGGGAGGGATSTATNSSAGSGGGAGEVRYVFTSASTIGASKAVTIGAAGAAGVGGAGGGGGGATSVAGSICTANGGAGGPAGTAGAGGLNPGVGGSGGSGGIGVIGGYGGAGIAASILTINPVVGFGGSNSYSAGAYGTQYNNNTPGLSGLGCGAGGSGALSINAAGATAGGTGTAGCVYVVEYLN